MAIQVYPRRLCRIVLIHGTWPDGIARPVRPTSLPAKENLAEYIKLRLRWFDPMSDFRRNLRFKLQFAESAVLLYPFVWKGSNSVLERDKAAQALSQFLSDALRDFPEDQFVLLAHSHGGNIALRALDYLGADSARFYVITMATPFLQVYAKDQTFAFEHPGTYMLGASFMLFTLGLLDRLVAWRPETNLAAAATFLSCLLLAGAVTWLIANPFSYGKSWSKRPEKIADASHYDLRKTPPARLLVLRAIDDEASLALAAGSIGQRLANSFTSYHIPRIMGVVGFLMILALGSIVLFPSLAQPLLPLAIIPWYVTLTIAMYAGLAGSLLIAAPSIFRSLFGRELLLGAARCDISAESVPDLTDRIDVITLKPRQWVDNREMRHAIYAHSCCVETIAEWILRVVQPPLSMFPYVNIDGEDWLAAHQRLTAKMPPEVAVDLEALTSDEKSAVNFSG